MIAWRERETPGLATAFDDRFAVALDDAVDGTVGLSPGLATKARGQLLHEGRHGRHRRAAGERVEVAQLDPVPGIDRRVALQPVQRFTAAVVGVAEDRRSEAE